MSLKCRLLLVALTVVAYHGRAAAQHASTVVIVVRHAEKASTPTDDPPLTAAGRARAQVLATTLAHAGVTAIITTQLIRSRETARPLADSRGLTLITVPRGADIAQHARAVAAAIRRHRGTTVLVVGHGETVGPIISALGGPSIAEICGFEYSNLYTLVLGDAGTAARFVQSTYGDPSPPHTSPCTTMMNPRPPVAEPERP